MYVKIHIYKGSEIIAICDANLIGKKIEGRDRCIEASKRFYKGEKKSEKEIVEIMKQAENLNLLGKKTVSLALKNKIIKREGIIKIKDVPHAQMYQL